MPAVYNDPGETAGANLPPTGFCLHSLSVLYHKTRSGSGLNGGMREDKRVIIASLATPLLEGNFGAEKFVLLAASDRNS